jgi:hypothetical protein
LRERLDRSVATGKFPLFPNARVINEGAMESDHRPVTVDMEYLAGVHVIDRKKVRRFEAH